MNKKKALKKNYFMGEEFNDDHEGKKVKYLTFGISEIICCMEMGLVKEIIAVKKIIEVPSMPEYVAGVINLNCKIIPVIDLRIVSRKYEHSVDNWTFIVIISVKENLVGLVIDTALRVESISENEKASLSKFEKLECFDNERKDEKILLDTDKIIREEELSMINENIENRIRPIIN